MKKFFLNTFIFFLLISILLLIRLSTIGIETKKFNNLISGQINQFNNNINVKLDIIKYKIDINQLSLFLQTSNPQFNFKDSQIPVKHLKVFINFKSLILNDLQIKKISLSLSQVDVKTLKRLSLSFKPSNFKSFISNKIKEGSIDSEIEIYLNDKNLLDNFIAKGRVTNLKFLAIKDLNFKKTNFDFFADKSDILFKNINSETKFLKISDGDLKLDISNEIKIDANFKSNILLDNESHKFLNFLKNLEYLKSINSLEAKLNNNFSVNLDKTYKLKDYEFKINGNLIESNLSINKTISKDFFTKKLDRFWLKNSNIKINFNKQKFKTYLEGEYSLNKEKFLDFETEINLENEKLNLKLDADYDDPIDLNLINYKKTKGEIAHLSLDLEKKGDTLSIDQFNFKEKNNSLTINNLKFNKGIFISLENILVKTNKDGIINNDFEVYLRDKIIINGKDFDASNLPKFFNRKPEKNKLINLNKDIEIDFADINAPNSEKLKNFKLIGRIEKGRFVKISSKGNFGGNNFLDISMKEDKKTKKKYLEIYSDLTNPLLTEYDFFKGLTGGKLLYSSIIEKQTTTSKLKIENFKVINAPAMIKLLSLADLSGLADLAEGEGLSFDILEIKMEKNNNLLKLNEILALGPSISVLMEGYQSPKITSIRGTLVPAKTLNKFISKIPVIGDIVIPKEIGEGLFGISFKIKGPPGDLKTTINPIRTITPRFIQKIVDRKKNSK